MTRAGGPVSAVRQRLLIEWRTLARMRTAVILLAIVAALSVVATLLPQRALQLARADAWISAHQVLGPFLDRLGMFAVYESWPLLGAAALMYLSLGNCVWTRGRALYRRWRRHLPRNPQFIGEAGSLVFHLSFFVLLFGILWGKAAGFTAFVDVLEGQSVVEARPSYDQIEEGLLFNDSLHKGFEVKVNSFNATYYDNGKPKLFNSHVQVFDAGHKVAEQDVQVNQYLEYRGVKFYQASYGWAPVLQVTDPSGRRVFDAPVLFFGDPQAADGIIKVPSSGPPGQQLGALLFFYPDVQDAGGQAIAGSAQLRNPAVEYRLFKGDLQAARAQNVYELDTSRMTQVGTGSIFMGEVADLPGGYKLSFPRVMQYTGLQVTDDPGVPIIWFSFVLMLGGLLVRLYLRPLLEARRLRRAQRARLQAA